MKRLVTFVDANKSKVNIEIKISNGKFTMSGEMGGSFGQIYDSISPATKSQEDLLDLWKKYHLNDMNPGTPRQMEFLKAKKEDVELWKSMRDEFVVLKNVIEFSDYEFTKFLLEKEGLLYDTLPNGDKYIYGTGWLTEELPEDIEFMVEDIIEAIDEEENERKGDTLISELDEEEAYNIIEDISNDDADEIYAICLMFDLTANEIDDIAIEGNNRICVQGIDYLFGTDDEMDAAWDEELDNYLEEAIYPELSGHLQYYFDDEKWKRDAKYDGRGHSLNRYDGGEEFVVVKDVYYYAYRQ